MKAKPETAAVMPGSVQRIVIPQLRKLKGGDVDMKRNRTKAPTTGNTSGGMDRIARRTIQVFLLASFSAISFGAEVLNYDRGLAHPGIKHAMRYNTEVSDSRQK